MASSDSGKAEEVCNEINSAGGDARPYACDVRSAGAVRDVVDRIVAERGALNILFNCAGVYYPTPVGETSEAESDRLLDINIKGVWNCVSAVVPVMKSAGGGKIVNISSVAAFGGISNFPLYCASKAAVTMMTRSLACDLAPFDININAVAPGNTETPMNEGFRMNPDNADYLAAMDKATPSNRTFSKPEEIADLALYLASDAARAMHGSTVLIDEGISAGLG
jgi:3-oxoacyl-[acyl-carrier protein] reductase